MFFLNESSPRIESARWVHISSAGSTERAVAICTITILPNRIGRDVIKPKPVSTIDKTRHTGRIHSICGACISCDRGADMAGI